MIWFLAALLLVLAIGGTIAWRHNPTRKRILRNIDPNWRKLAKPGTYSAEEQAAEAEQMFVSSTEMRDGCDIIWDEFDPEPPEGFTGPHPDGTVVWVNTKNVPKFLDKVLPQMQSPFVLVTARQNNATSEWDLDAALSHEKLLHWFMENYEDVPEKLETGRITPLPLGLNYHNLNPKSSNQLYDIGLPANPQVQQLDMKRIKADLPPLRERPLKVYCNFHLNMDTFLRHHHAHKRANARAEARDTLQGKDFIFWEKRQIPRHVVWRQHAKASFEASPRGNSIDCHRTWEALILGTIPIVQSSLMDPIYEGLPVAIVKDWNEVTEEQLQAWKEEFLPWFEAPLPDQLYSKHWIERFHSFKP